MTGNEIIAQISGKLMKLYDPEEARAIARAYLADRLGIEQITSSKHYELPDQYSADLNRLESGEPLQYVTGIQHFMGFQFKVNSDVLIPRPETEELVQWVSDSLEHDSHKTILDVGTGSGCIPVTLKKHFPDLEAYATDISEHALETAGRNADSLGAKVHFKQDSILKPEFFLPEGFDIIISNPPYIPLSEQEEMAGHVVKYEPHVALFAPDNDPVIFYKAICEYAIKQLKPGGVIYFEVHPETHILVVNHLKITGFNYVTVRMDMSGKHRFIKASRQAMSD